MVAGFGLHLRGRPVPPLDVSEGLLDVAVRKLGGNALANVCGSIPPICEERLQFDGVDDAPPFGTGGRCNGASLYE